MLNLSNGMKAGIDNAAHIGGLVSGLVIGYAFISTLKYPQNLNLKYIVTGCLALVILTSSYIAYERIPNDFPVYQKQMELFVKNETKADNLLGNATHVGKGDSLDNLKANIIELWNRNLKLLQQNKKMNLPDMLHEKNVVFAKYYDYRLATLNLIYKEIKENT